MKPITLFELPDALHGVTSSLTHTQFLALPVCASCDAILTPGRGIEVGGGAYCGVKCSQDPHKEGA